MKASLEPRGARPAVLAEVCQATYLKYLMPRRSSTARERSSASRAGSARSSAPPTRATPPTSASTTTRPPSPKGSAGSRRATSRTSATPAGTASKTRSASSRRIEPGGVTLWHTLARTRPLACVVAIAAWTQGQRNDRDATQDAVARGTAAAASRRNFGIWPRRRERAGPRRSRREGFRYINFHLHSR